MNDFDVFPLYPKEWKESEFENSDLVKTSNIITSVVSNLCEHVQELVEESGTKKGHLFCIIVKNTDINDIVESTCFYLQPYHGREDKDEEAFCLRNKYERTSPLNVSVNVTYRPYQNINLHIKGDLGNYLFETEIDAKYEELLPLYFTEVQFVSNDGRAVCNGKIAICNLIHMNIDSMAAIIKLNDIMYNNNKTHLTIPMFRTGWTEVFGIKKYIPPRRAKFCFRSDVVFYAQDANNLLKKINSTPLHVLMFSFSMFAMCKSLFNHKSYSNFLLNITIPKPAPYVGSNACDENGDLLIGKINKKYYKIIRNIHNMELTLGDDYYGDNKTINSVINEIPFCFFTPEQISSSSNANLMAMNKVFSPATTYMNMLEANRKYFSRAHYRDFPVVLSGVYKKEAYSEYITKLCAEKDCYQFLPRFIPDKIIDSHLKSPLSFVLVDADYSSEKFDEILNFDFDMESSTILEICDDNVLSKVINNFILYLEYKLFDTKDLSQTKLKKVATKLRKIEDEFYNQRFYNFLKEIKSAAKRINQGKIYIESATYRDILNMYYSEPYKRNATSVELLTHCLCNEIKQRKNSYNYNLADVKKIVGALNITEEQYLSYILMDDDNFIFLKNFNLSKKELKHELKQKNIKWEETYRKSLISDYIASTVRKSDYMSEKLKEADEILKQNEEIKPEMRSRLKCLLAVTLCFDEFIQKKHPTLSEQSKKLVENTIALHKVLYFRETSDQMTQLDTVSAAKQFGAFILSLDKSAEEADNKGRYRKLFFKNKVERIHVGWYDTKYDDYYLLYSGINQCDIYDFFIGYLKNGKMETTCTFKQLLRSLRDTYGAIYTRDNSTGTHYMSHKKIDGEDRRLYRFYGKKINMLTQLISDEKKEETLSQPKGAK